ncbi:MAG: glycosyltransferase, partial [Leptotrichiaceae bacterium]|nr:glycosyltransferase [Leptotrichiaceae bacterium]
MKLSIIIPAYNTEEYIGQCIESVLNIKEIENEIIIINDGSTDKT